MDYLLSTFHDMELAQGDLCGTGDLSIKRNVTKIPTETRKREVQQLSNVHHAPTNTHSSEGECQLYILQDNEAVIKMIVKGRSPTVRHVSRTHRVALDWLFDNQLSDMRSKENFTHRK